jgi:transposase
MRIFGMPLTDPTPALPDRLTADDLPDDVATLKRLVLELLASLREERQDKEGLQQRIDRLLRRLYGPRGERFAPNQALLFPELATAADALPAATAAPSEPTARSPQRCRPHGRRRLPEHLRREPCHHELTEAERLCPHCGGLRLDIGVDKSEQLDYRPASLFVVEHLVHKYACPCCRFAAATVAAAAEQAAAEAAPLTTPVPEPASSPERAASGPEPVRGAAVPVPTGSAPTDPGQPAHGIVIAAVKPAMPIAKGLPGPGLLAHLIVSKYTDHLPLYRLERIYERQGLFLHRSTLCDWLAACAELLQPLYDLLVSVVLQSRALHTDDTPVKMQELVSHRLSTARFWVYLGDAAHPYNVFDFTINRKRDGPQEFLRTYQGYLHADAFSGYDGLYLPDPRTATARITEVACNAHARRKFYEARTSDALRAHQALAYYRQLYELEERARKLDFSESQRLQMRRDLAVPILEQFQQWLEAQRPQVLPKSPLGEAVSYALHNWSALVRYTDAGYLAIDNNVAEREMKRVAIGRKNWLFVGSPTGGRTATMLLSFTSTCHRLGVEPWAYLQDVLSRLPTTSADGLPELLPDRWQAARQGAPASAPIAPRNPPAPAADQGP